MLQWHLLWSEPPEIHTSSGQPSSLQQGQGPTGRGPAWLDHASREYPAGVVCHCFWECRHVATAAGNNPVAVTCAWLRLSVRGSARFAHLPQVSVCQCFPSLV